MSSFGTTGFNPHDAPKTHDLIYSIGKVEYYVSDFKSEIWNNGSDAGLAYYDKQYAMAGWAKQMWFCEIPIHEVPTVLPALLKRYNLWAVGYREPLTLDPKEVADMIDAYRLACPNVRLAAPNSWEPWNPAYYDALIPTLKKCQILTFHDYKACPGGGNAIEPPWTTDYYHPWQTLPPFDGQAEQRPDLLGRMNWLKGYCKYLKKDADAPDLICTEYGLYVHDVADAFESATAFRSANVPVCLWTPHSPCGQANSVPYGNGAYDADMNGSWSDPMKKFLTTIQ